MSLYDQISHNSGSSLLRANTSTAPVYVHSAAGARLPINRVLLPQPTWKSSLCHRVDPKGITQTIEFDLVGAPTRGYGVPAAEIVARGNLNGVLQGANDVVNLGREKIQFRILWPGYEHIDWIRTINPTPNLTKGQLAVQLSTHILHYTEKMAREVVKPANKQWAIGRKAITFEKVVLVSFFNVGYNSWQAELHIQSF